MNESSAATTGMWPVRVTGLSNRPHVKHRARSEALLSRPCVQWLPEPDGLADPGGVLVGGLVPGPGAPLPLVPVPMPSIGVGSPVPLPELVMGSLAAPGLLAPELSPAPLLGSFAGRSWLQPSTAILNSEAIVSTLSRIICSISSRARF